MNQDFTEALKGRGMDDASALAVNEFIGRMQELLYDIVDAQVLEEKERITLMVSLFIALGCQIRQAGTKTMLQAMLALNEHLTEHQPDGSHD